MLKKAIRLLTVWFALVVAVSTTFAQSEQATVTGIDTDESGAAIPNARVAVTNVDTKVMRGAQTNGEGQYRVHYLSPGNYLVTPERTHFTRAELQVNITIA